MALVYDGHRVHAHDDVDKLEAQFRRGRQALTPVAANGRLAFQFSIHDTEPLNDQRARHFEIVGVVR